MSGRIQDMDRRLDNWARWMAGGRSGGLGYASVNLLAAAGGDRGKYREATMPTSDCEGAETDAAVQALPSELRRTVEVFYLQGCGMARKAQLLAVTEATVRLRLGRAHGLIQSWLADQAQQRRAERSRVEHAVERARPPNVELPALPKGRRRVRKGF